MRDDGRIEFAVQQRTESGWSENILPRARTLPAFGDPTTWKSSTPVSAPVGLSDLAHVINQPELAVRTTAEAIDPILRSGWRTATISYAAELDDKAELNSVVSGHSEQGLQLQLGCFNGVARIQVTGAAAESTGAMTLSLDGARSAVHWNVAPEDGSSTLRPTNTTRMIQRLRGGEALTVEVGTANSRSAAFGLADMFETPIQVNIDQCDNHTDPTWLPVAGAQSDRTEDGTFYSVSYPTQNEGRRQTQITANTIGDGTGRDGQLTIGCNRARWFQVSGQFSAEGELLLRSRVDGGGWIEE